MLLQSSALGVPGVVTLQPAVLRLVQRFVPVRRHAPVPTEQLVPMPVVGLMSGAKGSSIAPSQSLSRPSQRVSLGW
jgi:hypothetical protein